MAAIPLMVPFVPQSSRDRISAVLDSGYLTEGPVTRELEAQFRDRTGCEHAIAVSNCTVGIETALRAVGVGPGDEVIVPDFTYPATGSMPALLGATVVLVDVNPRTMVVDAEAIKEAITPKTKAIIPVSLFGNPLDSEAIARLAGAHNIPLIEDAACALGATFEGQPVGSLADISVFSLHPRKFITTGEGGMITTRDAELAAFMASFKRFGMEAPGDNRDPWGVFARMGTNYKLSNLQAALGVGQMDIFDELMSHRRAQALYYIDALEGIPGIDLPETTPGGVHAYQSFCVFVERRDRIRQRMIERGIEVQIGTYALHRQRAFQGDNVRRPRSLPGSTFAFERCLTLPLYHTLTQGQQDQIIDALREEVQAP